MEDAAAGIIGQSPLTLRMDIWVLNHYADTPDRQATRTFDLCRELVRRRHRTTVFASGFSHYRLREERLSRGELWKLEQVEGVRFVWIRTPPYQRNDWRRIMNMAAYALRAFRVAARLSEQPDVIIGVTVHPLAPLAAYALARLKRSRFFCEVTDLWPETLIQFEELSSRSPIAWGMRVLEKFLFEKAERIIMLWPHADRYVAELGVSPAKVVWIPHGVPLSRYASVPPYNGRSEGKFTIMFAGGLVRANALDVVLDAAQILQEEEADSIQFVFVGDGADRPRVMNKAAAANLHNVEFRAAVAKHDLWKTLSEADAFILSLNDLPLYQYGVSLNKLCDYMVSGRPILFAGRPAYNPVEEAHAGITVGPTDARALARAAVQLMKMPAEERQRMGRNGLEYVRNHHDIAVLADRLETILQDGPDVASASRSS